MEQITYETTTKDLLFEKEELTENDLEDLGKKIEEELFGGDINSC